VEQKLEKQLRVAIEERRKLGRIVRRKWFERTSKWLFAEIYPYSTIEFRFSDGWFSRFLHRNDITLRIITNQAQETPAQHCEMIINFLCFNRRNSQLRDGREDTVYAVRYAACPAMAGQVAQVEAMAMARIQHPLA